MRFRDNTFDSLNIGIDFICEASKLAISGNDFQDSRIGLRQAVSADLEVVDFSGNVFEVNNEHALFQSPVVGSENTWDDIGNLQIFDSSGDGFGDCGADYPYTSNGFTGQSNAAARSNLSTQVQDTRPVTNRPPGIC